MPSPLSMCVTAARDVNAGTLLYRVNYWMARAERIYRKKLWVYDPRDKWISDTWGDVGTLNMYKRAIRRLRERDLVEVVQAPDPSDPDGERRVSHIRLTNHAYAVLGPVASKASARVLLITPAGALAKPPTKEDAETTALYKEQELLTGDTNKSSDAIASHPSSQIKKEVWVEEESKTDQSLQKVFHSNVVGFLPQPLSTAMLENIWRSTSSKIEPDAFVMPWNNKQHGQMNQLIGKIPAELLLPSFTFVLENWSKFCDHAEEHGAFDLPCAPNIDTIVKQAEAMVNVWKVSDKNLKKVNEGWLLDDWGSEVAG